MRQFWDKRFSNDDYAYGLEPNDFFRETIDKLNPGKLFLPGEGEGRNAVYAATKGWEVTAVDFSMKARDKALKLAKEMDTDIKYQVSSLEAYAYEKEKYDAIGLIYVHFPPLVRKKVHKNILSALKPGGTLIVEAFHKDQYWNDSGGPKNKDMLYNFITLRTDFSGMNYEFTKEIEVDLNEGLYHQGQAHIVRMLATKK